MVRETSWTAATSARWWIGSEKLGVSPKGNTIHLMVAAWAWGAYLGEEGMKRGIRVKTSATPAYVNITMTQAKTVSNYTNSILANIGSHRMAMTRRCCSMLGFVSEGAGETSSRSRTARFTRQIFPRARSTALPATPVFHIAADLGEIRKSASRVTGSTSATSCSSPAPLQKRRSANWTASDWRRHARPDHREDPGRRSISSTAAIRSTHWLTQVA